MSVTAKKSSPNLENDLNINELNSRDAMMILLQDIKMSIHKLDNRIDKLDDKIDRNTRELNDKINKLDDKIDRNTRELNDKIDRNTKELNDKIDRNTRELHDRIDRNFKWTVSTLLGGFLVVIGIIISLHFR